MPTTTAARKSHQEKLLKVYRKFPSSGLTDAEAAKKAGLFETPGVCWWKRSGELREAGLIEYVSGPSGQRITRMGDFGVPVGISVVTPKGLGH
jgi:hypothetical protein